MGVGGGGWGEGGGGEEATGWGGGVGGNDARNRLFVEGVGLSSLFASSPFFLLSFLPNSFRLSSPKSKNNASTISNLLFFSPSSATLQPKQELWFVDIVL